MRAAAKASATSAASATVQGHAAMDRASGLEKLDAKEVLRARDRLSKALNPQTSKLGIAQSRTRRSLPGDETRATPLGQSRDRSVREMDARLRAHAPGAAGRAGGTSRPQAVEVVTRDIDEELGVTELDAGGLAIGGDKDDKEGLGTVKPGGEMGVMYEAETDSEFDEREWGSLESESPDAFDERMAMDADRRMQDIATVRQTLAHRRVVLEGRAVAVGADPRAARALVRAGEDAAVTAPTTGRSRSVTVSGAVAQRNPRAPVEVPLGGTFGRRSIKLDNTVPRLSMEEPSDEAVLPVTLPDAPEGMRWHWVPETSTALPTPDGWNVAKGWGGFLGSRVLSVAVTPENPLVLNQPDPVTRSEALQAVEMRKAALAGRLRPEDAAAAGLGPQASRNSRALEEELAPTRELVTTEIDGREVTVLRERAGPGPGRAEEEAAAEPPKVTAANPAEHFLRVGLTYKAYIGVFTSEALTTSDPKELAKYFLVHALQPFTPPHELGDAGSGGAQAAGEAMLALTGREPGPGEKAWTLAQLTAASEAAQAGLDPVEAAREAGEAEARSDAQGLPRAGFSYAAFPDLDKPEAPIEPKFEEQWSYELIPGRVYGFGAVARVGWSPMGPDDISHRVHGGMRVAVSLTMDTLANVLHETVFRAPVAVWDEAWASHGERMLDDTCVAWSDEAADKYA